MKTHATSAVPLVRLHEFLQHRRGFPPTTVRPFAALLAHYGKSLDVREPLLALRKQLISYLDATRAIAGDDFHDGYDRATLHLNAIEKERGGQWPINAPLENDAQGPCQGTIVQVEPGLGKRDGRALTQNNMLLLMAVSILRPQCRSEAAAIRLVLDLFMDLGLPAPGLTAAPGTVSRTRKILLDLLFDRSKPVDHEIPFHAAGALAAYERLASTLTDDTIVRLPRALPADCP